MSYKKNRIPRPQFRAQRELQADLFIKEREHLLLVQAKTAVKNEVKAVVIGSKTGYYGNAAFSSILSKFSSECSGPTLSECIAVHSDNLTGKSTMIALLGSLFRIVELVPETVDPLAPFKEYEKEKTLNYIRLGEKVKFVYTPIFARKDAFIIYAPKDAPLNSLAKFFATSKCVDLFTKLLLFFHDLLEKAKDQHAVCNSIATLFSSAIAATRKAIKQLRKKLCNYSTDTRDEIRNICHSFRTTPYDGKEDDSAYLTDPLNKKYDYHNLFNILKCLVRNNSYSSWTKLLPG